MAQTETNWDDLVSDNELNAVAKKRSKKIEEKTLTHVEATEDYVPKGWAIVKLLKGGKVRVQREKLVGDAFEDRVWLLFKKMGYSTLNRSRKFTIFYGNGNSLHQQIDVFAVNEESVIVIECKASAEKKGINFKKQIDAFGGQKESLQQKILEKFPNRTVRFIWANHNYGLGKADLDRLKEYEIELFDDDTINYFVELSKHLGDCAKYQLYAHLFVDKEISNFNTKVPAIRSRLGEHVCYTFSIDPARLLQIGYILHHHSVNNDSMPAYQRLIKRERLGQIRKFVEAGGFFANSLIINIDTNGQDLQFDEITTGEHNSLSQVGILHLPARYRCAYVIDGQHRLYSYSGSKLANSHTLPVVAFENLDKHEQLKLFMDINENQKCVPKGLRVTLNADLLWSSSKEKERRIAIASKITQMLESNKNSTLQNRILVGENQKSKERTLTIHAIKDAIEKAKFLNSYNDSNEILNNGLLDYCDNQKSVDAIFKLLSESFLFIEIQCPNAWKMTDEEYTILVTNRGIQAIIRVIADIIRFLHQGDYIKTPKLMAMDDLSSEIEKYLIPLCDFINACPLEKRKELRTSLGGGADAKFWHEFQKVIHEKYPTFVPDGLIDYIENSTKQYNDKVCKQIDEVYQKVLTVIDEVFFKNYATAKEQIKTFPREVSQAINSKINDFEYDGVENVDFKTLLTFLDLRALVIFSTNWKDYFEKHFTPPTSIVPKGDKKAKTEWMVFLCTIKRSLETNAAYSVLKADADKVEKIHTWFCGNR